MERPSGVRQHPTEDLHSEWKIGPQEMLRHAIAPVRSYTKVSNEILRSRRMNNDAKVLLLVVQSLPEKDRYDALGAYAEALGLTPRQYRNARKDLIANGYLHEWKWQNDRGRWVTDQLTSNVTLTSDEAIALRDGGSPAEPPSERDPMVGSLGTRKVRTYKPVEEDCGKTPPHPPSQADPEREPDPEGDPPVKDDDPELILAERLLLSLRHSHRDLLLGVREARGLADQAAEWLRRGIPAADLRRALTAYLPSNGVRSAVGFLRHRLTEKMPPPADPAASAPEAPAGPVPLIACEGPGAPHVFRPAADETHCGPCRREAAREAHERRHPRPQGAPDPGPVDWRDHFDKYARGLIT
ncbi:hypothetical protein ABZ572_27855 [Streptomyces sp. NPDC018338]|uniref:hypothetical protein n=1 Tax=Streptomyces sp. NPDC018338 TaxID=3157192 RepID=UPI0033E376AC